MLLQVHVLLLLMLLLKTPDLMCHKKQLQRHVLPLVVFYHFYVYICRISMWLNCIIFLEVVLANSGPSAVGADGNICA